MNARLLALWVGFAVCAPLAPAAAAPVDDFINSEMKKQRIPGLSLAVVKNHKIVKLAGYGQANIETATPATPDSVYKIASLSKPFIAAAILLLVEDHRISLDDKISTYLDGAPDAWKAISIRQVVTHTSGIPRDPADYHPYQPQMPLAVITSAYSLPLLFAPGEKFLYSNVGYYVLAQIIEKAAAEPWEAFVARRLFAPAGLTDTRPLTNAIVPRRAAGYDEADGKLVNAENWIAPRPSAAFLSTARDMAKWDIFLDTHNPLNAADWQSMRTNVVLNDGKIGEYGSGWYIGSYLGHRRVHHDGQYPGFRSDYERFEDDSLSVIVLTNAGRPRVDSLALKIAGFFSTALAAPTFTVAMASPPAPAKAGSPMQIQLSVRSNRSAPASLLELEIWDADNKPVAKISKSNQDFTKDQPRTIDFDWTPQKPGTYWLNLGSYGPGFSPNYSWSEHLASLSVE